MDQADIFISYAHVDNEALIDGQPGWISSFHRVLEKRLAMLMGVKLNIWRDPQLTGHDHFDETISKNVGSRLFLPVLTPRYVRSSYCRKELEEFLRAAETTGGVKVGDKSRVFKVLKTPIELDEHPEPIRGLLGYEFYQLDPERKRLREFALDAPGVSLREQFMILIDDLAQEIGAFLRQIELGASAEKEALEEAPRLVVYLATTTSDLKEARDIIRRELLEAGHRVLPEVMLPLDKTSFETAVRSDLAGADLAVHLIGEKYGLVPEDALRSSAQLQLDLAGEHAVTSDLQRLIWLPPHLEVADPRQQGLIDELYQDQALVNSALLQTTLEELKANIHALLRPAAVEATEATEADDSVDTTGPLWIYLLSDPRDVEAVAPLEDLFWDAGFEVRVPLPDGNETELREEHEENLRLCDAFVAFYGHGNERWLRKILSDFKRARGLGRERPILAKAIYVAPPEEAQKARFRTHEADVLQGLSGFEPRSLEPFIARLSSAGS